MIVALVGILATMSMFFIRRYLQSSKTAEARNSIGGISRAAVMAYERGVFTSQSLTEGNASTAVANDLCDAFTQGQAGRAVPMDETRVSGKKYQPNTQEGFDYQTGDNVRGWKCLRFSNTRPQYYQYGYRAHILGAGGNNKGQNPAGPLKNVYPQTAGPCRTWPTAQR